MMKKIAFICVAVALVSLSVPVMAGEKLTAEEVKAAFVGNTYSFNLNSVEHPGSWGEQRFYLASDGNFYTKNSWGEESRGTYTIKDDGKVCYDFKEKPDVWKLPGELCLGYQKEGDVLKTSNGRTINAVTPGDAR